MSEPISFELALAGRNLAIETGKLAHQADAAVVVRYGDSVVLVTLCVNKEPGEADFLPLTVDYEERLYAAGKIPGGFIRREGRPTEEAVLTSRLTDRSIRPLLPKQWRRETQVIITVLSTDRENDPDILSVIGASATLSLSSVPFYGPIGAVRIGYINKELVVNPSMASLENSLLDLVVVSTRERVVMIETGAKEVSEDVLLEAIKLAHQTNQQIIDLQERMEGIGKPKESLPPIVENPELASQVASVLGDRLSSALMFSEKAPRDKALDGLRDELLEKLHPAFAKGDILHEFDKAVGSLIRSTVLKDKARVSGRKLDEIRPLSCEVGLLPRVHGSALFTRGETQVLSITTLGPLSMVQRLDSLGLEEEKRFMHHYNFPPFSTGEVKRVGTPGRREIGHGALAEKALSPVVPAEEDFPYAIRVVSEVLSSSGSTSMASTCASSLSLMDAGVPVKKAVAGISIGLVSDEAGNFELLTDIEGIEDNYGDMDFKVAGTADGVTAIQLDTKIKGLTMEIIEGALNRAREARLHILDVMSKAISLSRPELRPFVPRVYKLTVDPEKIGAIIGTGGRTIRSIIDETKTTIDVNDDGRVMVGATDEASAQRAISIIERLTKTVKVGEVYTGRVTRTTSFGAFVELVPGKEGMVHISELANHRVDRVEDVVKVGDEVTVKVIDIDSQGRINLSRRVLLEPDGDSDRSTDHVVRRPPPRSGNDRERGPRYHREPRR